MNSGVRECVILRDHIIDDMAHSDWRGIDGQTNSLEIWTRLFLAMQCFNDRFVFVKGSAKIVI